jgi:hypothetical protein
VTRACSEGRAGDAISATTGLSSLHESVTPVVRESPMLDERIMRKISSFSAGFSLRMRYLYAASKV